MRTDVMMDTTMKTIIYEHICRLWPGGSSLQIIIEIKVNAFFCIRRRSGLTFQLLKEASRCEYFFFQTNVPYYSFLDDHNKNSFSDHIIIDDKRWCCYLQKVFYLFR